MSRRLKGHFVRGRWTAEGGEAFASINPATGEPVAEAVAATPAQVDAAVRAARDAFEAWADLSAERRKGYLIAYAAELESRKTQLAEMISLETGKPRWESLTEVAAMINKVPLTAKAYDWRCKEESEPIGDSRGVLRYKPHGVCAVFGPFNLPGHLPNGHIVPALIAGNTVVFKPSELAPGVAEITVECWEAAGIPTGVINLVQGGRATGEALVKLPGVDGIFFTGGTAAGLSMRKALTEQPGKILALEMGGNNPLIVHGVGDLDAAAYETVQSAFLTAGQRCSCARRLIVPEGREGDAFLDRLASTMQRVKIGAYTEQPEPFMGPLITRRAADQLLAGQDDLLQRGGRAIVPLKRLDRPGAFLSPGLIDMTRANDRPDREHFGPLLQLVRVPDFDAAIEEANRTAFGLSAGLFCDDRALYEQFARRIRAGVVNWNRQLTNASSRLPFGGVGLSGNHRPAGFFSVDYCAYPVASIEAEKLVVPKQPTPGLQTEPQ